ncbi:MAG: heme ABC exporter ATP-binding protein CcmA, partial [Xanthomonadales bacterium]|nr:heme ABC exporter ATP-binding protein CcmA [Xanthomonadales bacterium]
VFTPVDLSLGAGELLLVVGANGSGKTTLLRLLSGLLDPAGDGRIDRQEPVCYVGHSAGIKDDLSVAENLALMAAMATDQAVDVNAVAARLGLGGLERRAVRTLSAGQRRRCALGRLLVQPAPLWLLDEPYANLDVDGLALIDTLIAEHLAGGGAVAMATHGAHRPPVEPRQTLTLGAAP